MTSWPAVFQPGGGRTELGQPGPGQIGRDGELTVVTQMFWHRDKWLSPSIRTFLDMVREVVKTGDVLERIESTV